MKLINVEELYDYIAQLEKSALNEVLTTNINSTAHRISLIQLNERTRLKQTILNMPTFELNQRKDIWISMSSNLKPAPHTLV